MNNTLEQIESTKQDIIHVSFGRGERYLYEWLIDQKKSTPFTMSGLIKRILVNDLRRSKHTSNKNNLYPLNLQATGF
jgi:hypothetical protein